jgi:hypothetical protein
LDGFIFCLLGAACLGGEAFPFFLLLLLLLLDGAAFSRPAPPIWRSVLLGPAAWMSGIATPMAARKGSVRIAGGGCVSGGEGAPHWLGLGGRLAPRSCGEVWCEWVVSEPLSGLDELGSCAYMASSPGAFGVHWG